MIRGTFAARLAATVASVVALTGVAAAADDGPSMRPPSKYFVGTTDSFAAGLFQKQLEPLSKLTPVTDVTLRDPPPADWLLWRRTYNAWGYSPLAQINRTNVGSLQLAWAWSVANGAMEDTPLVHDGVLFIHSFGDRVEALDAVTGTLLWEYVRALPKDAHPGPKKNMAIYGELIIFPTSDAHMVALNMKTGKVAWDQEVSDYKEKWSITGGPLAVNGKVITGMSGCGGGQKGGCFIVANDALTGKELWRFNTIARPGQPGGDSWNGLPLEDRYGGSVWVSGSYDPASNLVLYGVGQPYPWNSFVRGTSPQKPGKNNDLLFTNSTLALNPDTGKLVWYYNHLPNDTWDMDYIFERTVVDVAVDGKMRHLAVTAGKMAIFEALDAVTGKFVFAKDLGLQTMVRSIDPKTGKKTYNPDAIPSPGKTAFACPFSGGARSYPATGYNPTTKTLYVPMQESCSDFTAAPLPPGTPYTGGSAQNIYLRPRPDTDGNVGRLEALNLETRQPVWIHRERAPQSTASLPTAGGIVFQGSWDRYFRAYNDATGEVLWQTRLNDVPNSFPVTYSVNGKQYVAVTVGAGGAYEVTWDNLLPDVRNPTGGGAAVLVFQLPDKLP